VIQLGPIELELVTAQAGDEGWSEHWQVFVRRGKRRALLGHAVNPEGAARIAVMAGLVEVQRGAAGRALRDLAALVQEVRELLRTNGPGDPANASVSGKETTS